MSAGSYGSAGGTHVGAAHVFRQLTGSNGRDSRSRNRCPPAEGTGYEGVSAGAGQQRAQISPIRVVADHALAPGQRSALDRGIKIAGSGNRAWPPARSGNSGIAMLTASATEPRVRTAIAIPCPHAGWPASKLARSPGFSAATQFVRPHRERGQESVQLQAGHCRRHLPRSALLVLRPDW
jgi:hypothetical protein